MSYWEQWGGQDAYASSQQKRYEDALKKNDTDLINRLKADAQRVGYTLTAPSATSSLPPSGTYTPTGEFIPKTTTTPAPATTTPKAPPPREPKPKVVTPPTQQIGWQAPPPPGGQVGQQEAFSQQPQMTSQVQDMLSQILSYINRPPQTPEELMQGEAYQGMKGAIEQQTTQRMAEGMRNVRAQLAASGVLGEGSSPAVERMGQVTREAELAASQQLGALIPQLMQAAQGQRSAGLQELLSGLGAQSGSEAAALNRILGTFQTYAPYEYLTRIQRETLPIDWAQAIGEVPPTYPGQTTSYAGTAGGQVPQAAQQYVSGNTVIDVRPFVQAVSPGAKVDWDASRPNEVRINGFAIQGRNINGKMQVPVEDVMLALGV